MDIEQIKQYTRAVAVVNDLPRLLSDNDKIWISLKYYTKSDYNSVSHYIKTNTMPKIVPVLNLVIHSTPCFGHTPTKDNMPNVGTGIEINQNLLQDLQSAKLKSTIYDTAFLLAVTLLHELVHYIRYLKKQNPDGFEWGSGFENYAFGNIINEINAGIFNSYQHSFTNLKWAIRNDKIINDSNKY